MAARWIAVGCWKFFCFKRENIISLRSNFGIELLPVLTKKNFLIALIGGRQRFFFWTMNAPKIVLLIGDDDAITGAMHFHAERCIVEVPTVKQIGAPREIVLCCDEKPVDGLDIDKRIVGLGAMRIDDGLGLASVEDAPVSTEPVPPNAGLREITTADDADGADGGIGKNI